MSLEPEYFFARDARKKRREKNGYIELDDFDKIGVSEDDLHSAGILTKKNILSTTDLRDSQVSKLGKSFLISEDYQLIFVHKSNIAGLKNAIEQ